MAERPSDEWFREHGWTEYATCWVKDYDSLTFRASKGMQRVYTDANGGGWYWEAVNADDPKALHAAWEAEQKRRETPLDPEGWQHFDGCSVHTEGGYRINQDSDKTWCCVVCPNEYFDSGYNKIGAIAACNRHARENGVKSC